MQFQAYPECKMTLNIIVFIFRFDAPLLTTEDGTDKLIYDMHLIKTIQTEF